MRVILVTICFSMCDEALESCAGIKIEFCMDWYVNYHKGSSQKKNFPFSLEWNSFCLLNRYMTYVSIDEKFNSDSITSIFSTNANIRIWCQRFLSIFIHEMTSEKTVRWPTVGDSWRYPWNNFEDETATNRGPLSWYRCLRLQLFTKRTRFFEL